MENNLNASLAALRKRVRILLVERYGLFGGAAGLVAASVMVALAPRYFGLLDYRLWALTVVVGALAGCVLGFLYRLDDLTLATATDRRTGLRERVSTAVFVGDSDQEVEQAVVRDAQEHMARYRASEVFPHRWGRPHAVFGVAALLFLGVLILPQLPVFQSPGRRAEVKVMQAEGKKMQEVAKEIRQRAKPNQEEYRKLAARLEELGRKMETGRMEKKPAMLKIEKLSKEVREAQDRLARANSAKPMEQARGEMAKSGRELAKSMAEKLAKQKGISPEEAMKMLPSDKRLAELAKKTDPLTAAEKAELQKALEKYADPSSGLPIPKELGEALAKLMENEDFRKASEIMQKLAEKLNSGEMSEADREALEKQLEQLAKALENTDLDELAKQMLENAEKLAQMSPEELEKLIKEAEKAQQMAMSLKKAAGT